MIKFLQRIENLEGKKQLNWTLSNIFKSAFLSYAKNGGKCSQFWAEWEKRQTKEPKKIC